jgi:type 2 lantibiotic biosynthesis protein LanM
VLELNVARLLGLLQGDTPAQRFASFVERLRTQPDAWESLLAEYPILARRVTTEQQHFVGHVIEVLTRLTTDWDAITATFPGAQQTMQLIAMTGDLSDGHRGGRSVWKLTFAYAAVHAATSSGHFHLIYKPKAVAVDRHFQQLLGVCNTAAQHGALTLSRLRYAQLTPEAGYQFPTFYQLHILAGAGHAYGWVEYVESQACQSQSEVIRFYRRQGGFLALAYLLHATDLHYENIIAHGEHPVLVDLETLFHQPFRVHTRGTEATARAEELLEVSVLRTGLLPRRAWGDAEHPGVNIGGLGSSAPQVVAQPVAGWADTGTDHMRAAPRHITMSPGANLPRLAGTVVAAAPYTEEIVAGFEAMLRFVCAHRAAWLSDTSPLSAFVQDEVRHVMRATTVYAKFLNIITHPDYLRSAPERDGVLALLRQVDPHVPVYVVLAEEDDLCNGDVPLFTTSPGSRDLWDSRAQRYADFFTTDCLSSVRAGVQALDENEIVRQIFLVRAALSAASFGDPMVSTHTVTEPLPAPAVPPTSALAVAACERAVRIGDQLIRQAICGDYDATWIGMVFSGDTTCHVAPVDGDLYNGVAGIAIFLTYLSQVTREPRFVQLAYAAARATHTALLSGNNRRGMGGFIGVPSQLYALAHAAVVLQDEDLLTGIEPVQAQLLAAATCDEPVHYDVIYGAAGCILALLALYAVMRDEALLATAVQWGRRLVRDAVYSPMGAAWPSRAATQPLLGFSHGTAGIAYALARLAVASTGHDDFVTAAHDFAILSNAAIQYERTHFDAVQQNWPDLRTEGPARQGMIAWCHGAPGVLLSRLMPDAATIDATTYTEIETAATTTLSSVARTHTLCHGEVGNLLIVAQAAAALQRSDWQQQVDQRLAGLLHTLHHGRPQCGFAFPDAVPSLMTGLAGIGYGLLWLGEPQQVASVLSLAPPICI